MASSSLLRFAAGVAIVLLAVYVAPSSAIAVMSIDIGSEWMKVAVVTPGVPMEIALNPESKRKTAVAVGMRDGERVFGGDAVAMGARYPKNVYFYFLDLVGKQFDHPQVKLFRQRFPFYELKAHPDRGTVLFQHDENTSYSPEELLAMVFEHARRIAQDFTEQKIKDAVIVIPAYFNQAERRSLLEAADMAGINCLQLISEPMAVSLNYGMFRRKEINGTAKHMMFFDMGSQDTTVSIVSFQTVKTKERGFTETHPQAQVLGVGYERNLGGLDLQIRLRDYLAKKFNEMGKTKTDVLKVPRAMGKLFKEVRRFESSFRTASQVLYSTGCQGEDRPERKHQHLRPGRERHGGHRLQAADRPRGVSGDEQGLFREGDKADRHGASHIRRHLGGDLRCGSGRWWHPSAQGPRAAGQVPRRARAGQEP